MTRPCQFPMPPLAATWRRLGHAAFLLLMASTQGAAAQAPDAPSPNFQQQGAVAPRTDAADPIPRGGVVQPQRGTDPEMSEQPPGGDANMPVIQPPRTGVSDKQAGRPPVPDR